MNNKIEAIFSATGVNDFLGAFDKAANATKQFEQQNERSGNMVQNFGNKIKSFVGTATKIAGIVGVTKLVAAGFDLIKNSVAGAVSRADTLNAFPRVMEQMGFSTEQSTKAINDLSDGIEGLPTPLDEVAGTAQRLAVMTGDLDGAVETTLALNNAFLASGASTGDASRGLEQYTQMLSKGEVDLQSWRTLQETMGVALNKTAEAFGFTGKAAQNDLYAALKDGTITFDEFNAKLIELSNETGGFADMAQTASKGIATSWQNVKTAVVKGLADMVNAIDSAMQGAGFGSIAENLDRVKSAVGNAFAAINSYIPPVMGALANLFNTIKESTAWNTLIEAIKMVIDWFGQLIQKFLESQTFAFVVDLLKDIAGAILEIDFVEIITQIGDFTQKWAPLIAGITGAIAVFQIISGVIPVVVAAFNGFMIIKQLVSTVGLLQTGFTLLAPVIGALNLPLIAIVAVIGTVIAAGVLLYQNWDIIKEKAAAFGERISEVWNAFKEKTSEVWNAVKEVISTVWESISIAISTAIQAVTGIVSAGWQAVVTFTTEIWSGMAEFFSGVWVAIKEVVSSGIEVVRNVISTAWEAIKIVTGVAWEAIKTVIYVVVGLIYTIVSTNIELVKTVITTAWNLISTVTSTVWNAISGVITSVWSAIVAFISPIIEGIKNTITTAWNAIKTATSTVWNAIKTVIMTAWNGIKTAVTTAVNAVRTVITTVWNAIKSVITTVMNGIKSVVTTVWNSIKSVITTVVNAIKSVITTVWNAIKSAITTVMNAIKTTVTSVWNAIRAAVTTAVNAIRTVVTTVWNRIKSVITTVLNGIKSTVSTVWNGIRNVITTILNGIKSTVNTIWNGIRNVITTAANGIKTTISNTFNALRGIVSSAFSAVTSAVSTGMSNAYSKVTGFISKFYQAGKNIIGSIANGIKSQVGKVTSAIGGVVQKVRDFLPFSPAKTGPLKDLNKLNFGGTISDSIYGGEKKITGAMDDILTVPDIDVGKVNANISRANRQIESKLNYEMNIGEQEVQPAYINLAIGGQNFKAFVNNISNAQGEEIDLNNAF